MTDVNPYAAPRAAVQDPNAPPGRPVWVWIILALYVLSAVLNAASYAMIFSGAIELPEPQQRQLAAMSGFEHVFALSMLTLRLVAAIQLFRLRKSGAFLFIAAFAIGLLTFGWRLLGKGADVVLGQGSLPGLMMGWTLSIVVCLYAWRLYRTGVLR